MRLKKYSISQLAVYIIGILLVLIAMIYNLLNYGTHARTEIFLLCLCLPISIISFMIALFLKTNVRKFFLLASSLSIGLIVSSFILSNMIDEYQIEQSYERAEKIILAVEKYYDEKGEYPDAIERLSSNYLETIPRPLTLDNQFNIWYDDVKRDYLLIFSSSKYTHYYSFENNLGWSVMGGY